MMYTLVQHSGYGYGDKPGFYFYFGLEVRSATFADMKRVKKVGGFLFPTYQEADRKSMELMFPPENDSLYPAASVSFSTSKVDGLRIAIDPEAQP